VDPTSSRDPEAAGTPNATLSTGSTPDTGATEAAAPEEAATKRASAWRGWLWRQLRRGVLFFLILIVIEYFVIPDLSNARHSLSLLGRVNFIWVVVGTLLEAGSLLAYTMLTRSLLPKGAVSLSAIARVDLTTLAVTHVVPGGTAAGSGLGYRLLTTNGAKGTDAGFALATQGIGSAVVLNCLLWAALLISIPLEGFNRLYVAVALLAVLLLFAFGALIYLLTRGEEFAIRVFTGLARKLPFLHEDTIEGIVRKLATRVRSLGADRELLRVAVAWASANWLLDAAALWSFLAAFGHLISPISLFVAYGVAMVMAVIPITPGGLGIVEAVAAGLLAGFHVPFDVALLAVLGWRLVEFWLPIPVGAGCYISLRVDRHGGMKARRAALGELAHTISATEDHPSPTPSESAGI
jgi:uncharacterized protein (TIRG00374 family)